MASLNRVWGYAYARPTTPNTTNAPLGLAPGCTVNVLLSGTNTPATLYADAAGQTPLANPFVSDVNGYYDCYTTALKVDVQFSGTGIVTPYTIGDVENLPQVPTVNAGSLPLSTAATAGVLVRRSDLSRGLWQDVGAGFVAVNGAVCNVKDFGAVGDGTTDDTVAIQAAITAQQAGYGRVYLPPGTYRITASLVLNQNNFFQISGCGTLSKILNNASAGNPTFYLNGQTYFNFDQFAIIGQSGFPNDAIQLNNAAFGSFNRMFLCPNGNGYYFTGSCNTILIDDTQYWPSGYNAGASRDSSKTLHAVWAAGVAQNDIHIRFMNAVGYETVANGGSCIKFSPSSNANNISVSDCEFEGTPPASAHEVFDFTNVIGFSLRDCFIENSVSTFLNCQAGSLDDLWMGETASFTFGDGTLGNRCGQIKMDGLAPNVVTITADCYNIAIVNCILQTLTDGGTGTLFLDSSAANLGSIADYGFPFGLSERGRAVAMGAWIAPAYNSGIFFAQAGTWTVLVGSVLVFQYTLVGKTMTILFGFDTTSLSGGPASYLEFSIPGGFTSNVRTENVCRVFNNSGSVAVPGVAQVFGGYGRVRISPVQGSGGSFANSSLISAFGQITFEVQ